MKQMTVRSVLRRKGKGVLTMLTAYDFPSASILEAAEVDMILVGDSVGNVILGFPDTLRVTMEHMLHHTAAVSRTVTGPLVVGDMPFMSCTVSREDALRNAGRMLAEGGAHCVKVEGGQEVAATIAALVAAGIPVVGHIGLTPQYVHQLGGYRYQGRTEPEAIRLLEDAKAVEAAGAFAIVLECIPESVANQITAELAIPTIGIGAGDGCDGQVLVFHDLLGLNPRKVPSFVRPTADLRTAAVEAVKAWCLAVRERRSTPALGENPSAEGAV